MPSAPRILIRIAALVGFFGAAGIPGGCHVAGGSSPTFRAVSQTGDAVFEPVIRTAVYKKLDANTASIILSDMPEADLESRLAGGAPGMPGAVLHLQMFVQPYAGRTPVASSACNTSITLVIFSGESMGVYGGGGFMFPSSAVGDATFSARMSGATMRLLSAGDGFADRLGLAEAGGRVNARRDDELADAINSRLTMLLAR